jgi:adenylate cyclase
MNPTELDQSQAFPGRSRRLAAVMFADMVGYSTRMEQDELRNSGLAARSVELFKSLIGDYGGEVANVAGDGILALFDSAEQALRFAMQIQREFRDQAVWIDGAPIQFRIGLNLGEIIVSDGNVQGHSVNIAARLQTMADPGGIYVTAAVRAAVQDFSGLALRPLGYQSLKNISQPVEVFAIAHHDAQPERAIEIARATPAPEPSRQPSVAVLALTNLSGDPANDHLCEGIVEDVIANLSRFRGLMVIARHSAFLFSLKSQAASEIGRRLGVRYLLGGSLRRAGKRVRIAVELIDATSESVLWFDRFDIGIEELFDVQDEIAGAVASRLSVQIDFAERRQESQYPRDMRAYGLVLRGSHLLLHFSKEANWHARRLFEEAIGIAPDYARAYSAMSRTHNLDWRYSWSSAPDESLDAAVDFARRAIQRDRLDARGFAEVGFAKLYKKQHDEALREYVRAMALNPNDADIIAEYADALVYDGQPLKSVELLERAMRLNPYFPDWYLWYLADAYNAMARPEDVIATVQRMQNPAEGRRLLAANFAHLDRLEEASGHAREVMRLHPGFTIGRWRHRPPYRDTAILERYVEGLRRAGLPD